VTHPDRLLAPDAARPAALSGAAIRVAACIGGLLLLFGGAVFSLGSVLFAPVGMGATAWVQRRRGHRMTRAGSWLAAVASVAIVLAVAGGVLTLVIPTETWRQARLAADSASAASAKEPPPAWLERMAPGATQRAAQSAPMSPRVETAAMLLGGSIAVGLFAALFGSLGWVAGMLFGLAFSGHWPGSAAVLEADPIGA
jgi:hypothetical protein